MQQLWIVINNSLTQHVSGTATPIFRSDRLYITAHGFQHLMLLMEPWSSRVASYTQCTLSASRILQGSRSNIKCWKPYAVLHSLSLLKMSIVVPETCWVHEFLIKIVASSWSYLSVHIKDSQSCEHETHLTSLQWKEVPIELTLILRRSRTGTVWFYTSTSN